MKPLLHRAALFFALLVPLLGLASLAHAATSASPDDPGSTVVALYDYLRSGKGTAAAGAALMLAVWAMRSGLGAKVSWFKTQAGGYVLGFGSAALLYVGTGLMAGAPLTLSMLVNAMGAGWAAAGAWEKLRDVLTSFGKPPAVTAGQPPAAPPAPPTPTPGPVLVTRTLIAPAMVMAIVLAGCSGAQHVGSEAGGDVIDCTKGELAQLAPIAGMLAALALDGKVDAATLEAMALNAGKDVGGCMLAHLDAAIRPALSLAGPRPYALALDHLRAHFDVHAKYRNAQGDL